VDQCRGEQADAQRVRMAPQTACEGDQPGEDEGGEQGEAGQAGVRERLQVVVVRVDVAAGLPAAVVGRVRRPAEQLLPAAEIARIVAAGAEAVEAAAGERVLLGDGERAPGDAAVIGGGEMLHLGRELGHQPVEGGRGEGCGGGEQGAAGDDRGEHGQSQARQEQGADQQAQQGEQQRHALADEHDDGNGGDGQRGGGERAPGAAVQQAGGGGEQGGEDQPGERAGGVGLAEGAGQFAVAHAAETLDVAAGEGLQQGLERDVERGEGDRAGEPSPGGGGREHPGFAGGGKDGEADRRQRLQEGVRPGLSDAGADAGGGAEDQPDPPGQRDADPRRAQPGPVAGESAAQEKQRAGQADRDLGEGERVEKQDRRGDRGGPRDAGDGAQRGRFGRGEHGRTSGDLRARRKSRRCAGVPRLRAA